MTLGSEAAGTVEAVGAEVTEVAPGDRVAYAMTRGSYAEYAVVPAAQLVKIPDHVDFQTAAAAMLQGMTAHYLTHSTFPLKSGDTCLVHAAAGGAGGLIGPDGQDARRARLRNRLHRRKGRDCARERGGRGDPLYRTGLRGRSEAPHGRPWRGRGVRFGGQNHFREESELAAAARPAGAVRAVQRRGSAIRRRHPERQRFAVPHAPQPGASCPHPRGTAVARRRRAAAGSTPESSNCASTAPTHWRTPPPPIGTWRAARPPGNCCSPCHRRS